MWSSDSEKLLGRQEPFLERGRLKTKFKSPKKTGILHHLKFEDVFPVENGGFSNVSD